MTAEVKVGIVTDSTADIPVDLLESFGIEMVPALLIIDGETFEDGRQLSRADFYNQLPQFSQPPTTATPSPASFAMVYQQLIDKGIQKILSIHVASTLSGMLTSASQAAQDFPDIVQVLDSGQLSLGLGFQVIETAHAAQLGKSFSEVMQVAEQVRQKVRVIALINTLEYLRRSGRVSWLQAGVGELLRIKQLLAIEDGAIIDVGKKRTFDRALKEMVTIMGTWGPCQRLAVLHTGIPDFAHGVAVDIHDRSGIEPLIVEVTTIIGAHVGPGSIGLAGLNT
jgi:DegV family protein with EDD domain